MKSTLNIAIALFIIASMPAEGAVTLTMGGRMGYHWWKPPWSNGRASLPPTKDVPFSVPAQSRQVGLPSSGTYGVSAGIRFLESWFFSAAFQYGAYLSQPRPDLVYSTIASRRKINRYDFTSDAGYWFARYVAVMVTVQARVYDYTEKAKYVSFLPDQQFGWWSAKGESIEAGPGIGVKLCVPLYGDISLVSRLVAMILPGGASYTFDYLYRVTGAGWELGIGPFNKEGYHSVTGSFSLAVAYRIPAANIILSLEGSYEVARYTHHRSMKGFLSYGGRLDHYGGILLAADYTAEFGTEE